ncbi:MAG: hypothetical protein IPH49_15550 [Ignavibacteria bacterium]|nr:hypothetical protein [Ignavibacteria bacterium]
MWFALTGRVGKERAAALGLCPFHEDTEPSFAVDERKGLWNCLGKCGEGGTRSAL